MSNKITLSLFKEKIKPAGCEALTLSAYRMDGHEKMPAMAKYAGLGTLSCCDYLYIKNEDSAILIEDTNLGKQLRDIKFTLKDLENEEKENKMFRAKTILRQENTLKVYGSLLVLCRLSQTQELIAKDLKEIPSYDFYLVINDEDDIKALDTEIKGILDYLKQDFPESLKGQLKGAKLVKNVKILFLSQLLRELLRSS